jgi:3-oxoacyl-[acyl-carrier protein] reductase
MDRLADRIALITGCARGIGRGIALAFAQEGADVAVNDLQPSEELDGVANEIRDLGRQAWVYPGDVSDEEAVQAMVDALLRDAGRIDVLVTNAGISNVTRLVDMSAETWDRMIDCHLRGTFLCARAVIPSMMQAKKGKIITLGSQLGQVGRAEMVHYSAAKGGVIAFTKALARELGPNGIQVNCIAPGPIKTSLQPMDDDARERIRASLPLGRFGSVEDVAPTAVFLASSESDYYTGQTLGPNGGDVML